MVIITALANPRRGFVIIIADFVGLTILQTLPPIATEGLSRLVFQLVFFSHFLDQLRELIHIDA